MDSIEPDALYDERGDVSWSRPLLQGDVFDQIVLPGFGDEPRMVQIVTHPCAMRKGPALLPRITVAPVEPYAQMTSQTDWEGNLRVMPLAELVDGKHYATKFVDVTAAPAELLTRDRRIATLSNRGIYVLQQRLVKHYTRFDASLGLLRRESAPVLEEAQQQWDWIETVLTDHEQADQGAIEAEGKVYDDWLSEGDPSRRTLLKDEVNHTDIRKQAQRAAAERARGRD
ncbi:MAG TPA: hypothetical protein VFJ14_10140 [Nocardioidaceae bacterium]|nr:hypothetical protein [Nocardioidaceae bacterium]